MCRDYNPYSDSDSSSRRHSAVKVTMTFEGSPEEIRDVIHGAAKDAGSAREEVNQKNQEIQGLRDKLYDTGRDLEAAKERCDAYHKQYCQESDKVYTLNSKIRELERQLNTSNEANAKLRAALAAVTDVPATGDVATPDISDKPMTCHGMTSPEIFKTLTVGKFATLLRTLAVAIPVGGSGAEQGNKIVVIKNIRDVTGWGLKEAKDMFEFYG